MSSVRRIAILGAESTGKSWLTQALAGVIQMRGQAVSTVDEVLRTWCDREGRTPQPHEQMGIAQAQAKMESRLDEMAKTAVKGKKCTMISLLL
jgi:nicotinamide riboside kinase